MARTTAPVITPARTVGAPAQLALSEEYAALYMGQTVVYRDGDGKSRTGLVVNYELCGGGNSPWTLHLIIKRRGGTETVRATNVLDYA